MKRASIPKSGRVGDTVYYIGRYGPVAREHVDPKNPRTPQQQDHRDNVRRFRPMVYTYSATAGRMVPGHGLHLVCN